MNYQENLFFGAPPTIIERAKELRQKMTATEIILWEKLKNKQILGLKFRRQHPIDLFIADFYCHPIKLVIEIDGKYHNQTEKREQDLNRTAEMERFGIKVIRFTNQEVMLETERIVNAIVNKCRNLISRPLTP